MSDHDADGDSHMASSPELEPEAAADDDEMFVEPTLDTSATPSTPRQTAHLPPTNELSPPNSSHRVSHHPQPSKTLPGQGILDFSSSSSSTGFGIRNSSNTVSKLGPPMNKGEVRVHEPSGYKWTRLEDEPGYAWKNRKAQEEHNKALESIVGKEAMVGMRYGDLLLERKGALGKGKA
ncbi:MAG: hypothetical protein M1820_006854 [Bogoriella megaspora]|nr:MAG: hypothetical protein M1820_006854 [Bogoriella megaspora]